MTRRGLSSSSSVIGVGRRPLLQKIAATTVAVSMTIATANTFRVAKRQYEDGFMDSETMVREVVAGLEIRVAQVISDTFLWLAQVQTLIRLFPRHKEKVTIKWLGFALILLDAIFSCLNSFLFSGTPTQPLQSQDAIPALSYLFELAIGFIYASCVIYYSMSKYRFAFYHAKMRNICLVALLSITAVLIPVVFFVIDVSSPDIAVWGFYLRWVGAAAASVVVWEWVERIEALERDERKDGILGREIYDGDEMLDVTTANGFNWPERRSRRDSNGSNGHGVGSTPGWKARLGIKRRPPRSRMPFHSQEKRPEAGAAAAAADARVMPATAEPNLSSPAPPTAVATPVSRADTTSATSTVYAVRYHNLQASSPRIHEEGPCEAMLLKVTSKKSAPENTMAEKEYEEDTGRERGLTPAGARNKPISHPLWTAVSNPFKRKRASPPAEVAGAQVLVANSHRRSPASLAHPEKWNVWARMDAFTVIQREKLRARRQAGKADGALPVTIIPARPRGTRTWSPDDLAGATDATRYVPPHSNKGSLGNLDQASRNDERANAMTVPLRVEARSTASPQGMHLNQEPPPRATERDSALRQQNATSDNRPPSRGELPSNEAQELLRRHFPPEPAESRFDNADGSGVSCTDALTIAEPVTHPQTRATIHGSNDNGLHMRTATSAKLDGPDISSPE